MVCPNSLTGCTRLQTYTMPLPAIHGCDCRAHGSWGLCCNQKPQLTRSHSNPFNACSSRFAVLRLPGSYERLAPASAHQTAVGKLSDATARSRRRSTTCTVDDACALPVLNRVTSPGPASACAAPSAAPPRAPSVAQPPTAINHMTEVSRPTEQEDVDLQLYSHA